MKVERRKIRHRKERVGHLASRMEKLGQPRRHTVALRKSWKSLKNRLSLLARGWGDHRREPRIIPPRPPNPQAHYEGTLRKKLMLPCGIHRRCAPRRPPHDGASMVLGLYMTSVAGEYTVARPRRRLPAAVYELPRIPVMRSSRSFGPSGHSGCHLSGITWKSHMLTPKVDQPATLRTGASGDRAVFFLNAFGVDVGCRSDCQSRWSRPLESAAGQPKPFNV